jgi:hypothetical protein
MVRTPLLLAGAVFCLCACGSGNSRQDVRAMLPGKVGPAGEVVIVAEQHTWTQIQGAVEEIMERPALVLPQYEPRFDIKHLTTKEFNRFWKPHRNLIVFDIADRVDTQTPAMIIGKEKYAKDQVYTVVKARTAKAAAAVFVERGDELADLIERTEVQRILNLHALSSSETIERRLVDGHRLHSVIPRDVKIVEDSPEFLWLQRSMTRLKGNNNHDVQRGFFVSREPYTGPQMFSMQAMLARRDSVLQQHVSTEVPGSFMATEYARTPRYEEIDHHGGFASTLRGLWKMEGDFMGGPFSAMCWVDDASNELVTVDGYAYAPYFSKREYLREVEAIVRSFKQVPN